MSASSKILFAFVFVALTTASTYAAPPPITASAMPTSVAAGVSTPVVIKATISDSNFQSANLLRTDATGKTLATLGVLHDDGVNGDAVAGDKVWSYQVAVNESAPGTVYFRVSGAFRGAALRVLSNVVGVAVEARQTQPQITVSLSPPPNGSGWRNGPVTAHFTCTPQGSPIASCPADQLFSADGVDFKATGTATDQNGGSASVTSTPFRIDRTPPAVSVQLQPAPSGWVNTVVFAHFTCSDGGSGIDSCPADQYTASNGANQSISATATDKAGNSAQVTSATFSIDAQAPTITATVDPPANGNGWHKGPLTVHFECADALSGVATCTSDRVVTAEGGAQAITGQVTDNAGNTASATAIVNVDRTAPVIAFTQPADGSPVFTPSLTLVGTVSDGTSPVSVVCSNGSAAAVLGSQFECPVTLAQGSNGLGATATDAAGNTSSASRTLNYIRAPQVTITSPAALGYLNISPTTVTGTVDDPAATVVVNSIPAPVSGGTFTIALPLAEGPNVVTATATSPSGAVGTASVEVTLDTTPPRLSFTSPPDGFVTSDETISVSGIVNDLVVGTVNDEQARVTVNNGPAQVANRTFLASTVPLQVGPNTIQAVGRDRVGNSATIQLTVIRQVLVAPQIRTVSGNNQSGSIGSILPAPLVVALTDAAGRPAANQNVIFRVTQNDGLLGAAGTPAPTVVAVSDPQGRARVNWTLGHRSGAGSNGVEAYAVGFEGTALFTATGTQSAAGKIVVDTGNDQIGAINQALPKPLIAVVIDDGNNRLGGVPVTFTVKQGGGSIAGQPELTVVTDSDGRAAATLTLGLQEGNANNLVEATFPLNTSFPAAFTASGRAPGNPTETTIAGVVLDNSNVPIPGVTVRAVLTNVLRSNSNAVQNAAAVVTNAQGQFSIAQAPVGFVKLLIDGTTAQVSGTYPSLEYDLVTVAGQLNTVGQPIYLVSLNTANQLCVTASTGGGTLTIPEAPGFSLTFGPGQVTFPGGSKNGCVSVTVVNGDKVPMVPGFGQQPRFIVTIQPSGALFSPPAPITIPNVDGLKPREVTEMYSYDHDIGSFVAIGTGVVSEDGLVIRSSTGVGVLKAGWHCGGNPNTTGTAATCPTCQKCDTTNCVPDNGQSPPQTPFDCKKDKCQGGGVVSQNDDNDHSPTQCCYQGSPIASQPIADLAQCPNRVPGTWTPEYDGCSLQPLPAFFRNNPAGGISTLFSDDHFGPLATHQYACDEHDRCYQTCIGGGDMVAGQEVCDAKLRDIALRTCADSLLNPLDVISGAASSCFSYALAYYAGLSSNGLNLGKSAYEQRQRDVCKCCQ